MKQYKETDYFHTNSGLTPKELEELYNNGVPICSDDLSLYLKEKLIKYFKVDKKVEDLERQLAEARNKLSKIECICDVYKDMQSEYETGTEIPYWDIMNIIKDY